MKLHLGCGTKKIPGYLNIDGNPDSRPDFVGDVFNLDYIPDNSVSVIYASHVLEHSTRHTYKTVLQTWYNKLGPAGILRLAVPNLERVFEHYVLYKDLSLLLGFLYGGQRNQWDYHSIGFDLMSLTSDLADVGFAAVDTYDWKETEHADLDDYSQAYLPHLNKESGLLMSLNIEAIK